MLSTALFALLLAEGGGADFLRIPQVKIPLDRPAARSEASKEQAPERTCYHIRIIRPNLDAVAPMPGMRDVPAVDPKFSIPAPPACDLLKGERPRRK